MREMYVVTWNVHGMKDVDRMKDASESMRKKDVCIVVFTETHFDNHDCPEFDAIASKFGYKCFHVTRLMRRFDNGSGGVTIMVDERLKSRFIKESQNEDLIWVCVEFENEKVFVGGAYLVPPSSTRTHKAKELVTEIGGDVARFCLEGQVILAGDWNCKVGQLESTARERVFARKSVSTTHDERGKRMIELMNASDAVVLNGVQETSAQFTCKVARGEGIDDYLAVSCALVDRTSEMEYWDEKESELQSDHVAIACRIKMKKVVCLQRKEKREKRKTFQVVGKVRSWKFWYWLSEICDKNMEEVMEKMMREEQDVEACWSVLKKSIVDVLEIGRKKAKRKKEEEGEELREMKKELETLKRRSAALTSSRSDSRS